MFKKKFLALWCCIAILSGCAVTEIAQDQFASIKSFTLGEYYLDNGKYRPGIEHFEQQTAKTPDDPKAFYYLGRCYLAENQAEKALEAFKRSVQLDPGYADGHFWLGVAYAAIGNPEAERKSYETALAKDPDHVQALVYLGHNRFEAQDYDRALAYYNRALALAPYEPQALFNRGLIYRHFERTPEEILTWRIYLENYSQGPEARQAAEFLNMRGQFDYRNHLIGIRTITLQKIQFEPFSAVIDKHGREALDFLGRVFVKQTRFELHIIGYQQNNRPLAKARVKNIKRYLMERYPPIGTNRIKISWFDTPEKVTVGKKQFAEGESITFFTMRKRG